MKLKNIKGLVKFITIAICIFFICSTILSLVMSTNTNHLECCHEDNCPLCLLIRTAIYFTKNIDYVIQYSIVLSVTIPLCYIVIYKKIHESKNTLIDLKVRLDE